MDDDGILGGAVSQLGQTVKQAVKQVVKLPIEAVKDIGGQVGAAKRSEENKAVKNPQRQWQSDEERIKFLKDLYGKTDMSKDGASSTNKNANPSDKKPTEFEEKLIGKSPDEQKKLIELRNQLHKQVYFDPTFNRPKKQEERPSEKVEKEKKIEMQELQQKEDKKPPPLAVQREQNKTEMFRGVSG